MVLESPGFRAFEAWRKGLHGDDPQCPYGHVESWSLPDSIVYTDGFSSYDALDVSDFHHVRINHSERFVDERNHINGIENFWKAKRHHLFLKECEWRFKLATLS